MEIVNKEKEKVRYDFVVFVECNFHQHVSNQFEPLQADKAIAEIEAKCGQKIEECKEEQRQQLMRIEDEHTLLVSIEKVLNLKLLAAQKYSIIAFYYMGL